MKTLLRVTPWIAAAVALYQIGVVVAMVYASPGLVIYAGILVVATLFVGVALMTIFQAARRREEPSHADRSRRAMGWMLLSCTPTFPTLLLDVVDAGVGALDEMSFVLIVAALVVREFDYGHARWVVPLALAAAAGYLALYALELTSGCVLVAAALLLHSIAVMPKEKTS